MKVNGTELEIELHMRAMNANIPQIPLDRKMQMLPWQMCALYVLAADYCRPAGRILEIGTGFGTSAYMLAKARPLASIESLTINEREAAMANGFLQNMVGDRVQIMVRPSSEHWRLSHVRYDLIFVDGDHKRCHADLPWFNRLREGGLILFHDYSPQACPPVYAAVGELGQAVGREPDVALMDSNGIGMAGFVRSKGETWPT